ncbi:MAG: relaxase domain-containing protein [Acidimicrobiales bacterium]
MCARRWTRGCTRHAVIANRVLSPDGRWLALDARSLMKDQTKLLSSLYHAGLRAGSSVLGWGGGGGQQDAELAGVEAGV